MIDLFSSDTPNGKKISIMLEEIGFKYARPDEKLRFEFTTTSKAVQNRLGLKND